MPISQSELHDKITKAFPQAEIVITDLVGDGDHYQLYIKAVEFRGLSRVAQHKLIYRALEDCIGTSLHALALTTEAI